MSAKKTLVVSALEKCLKKITYNDAGYSQWASVPEDECKEIAAEFSDPITPLLVRIALLNAAGRPRSMRLQGKKVEELSNTIFDFLESFPRKYEFVLPLPPGDLLNYTPLSDNVSIGGLSEQELDKYTNASIKIHVVNPYTNAPEKGKDLSIGQNVLRVEAVGYVSCLLDYSLKEWDPFYVYKIIVAVYMVFGVIQRLGSSSAGLGSSDTSAYKFYCYDISEAPLTQFVRQFDESADDFRLLVEWQLSKNGKLEVANAAIARLLSREKRTHVKNLQRELKNSLYWYYEATQAHLPHLKPVLLVTAFDAFFAQNDSQDHIAKLIALTTSEDATEDQLAREEIGQLYNLRNRTVHGEKSIGVYNQTREQIYKELELLEACTTRLCRFINIKLGMLTRTQ